MVETDVRVLAATNVDVQEAMKNGKFREDLYYRLNVVPVELPPLRERTSDIPPLVDHFREKYNRKLGRKVESVSPAALDLMIRYPWAGNIRELENFMERLVLFADGPVIGDRDLPAELRELAGRPSPAEEAKPLQKPAPPLEGASLKDLVRSASEALERELITKALKVTGGNVTQAAERLKISRKTLQVKMKDLGLREPEERGAEDGEADSRTPHQT
jgi:DNA-binding NtrC family response regulator